MGKDRPRNSEQRKTAMVVLIPEKLEFTAKKKKLSGIREILHNHKMSIYKKNFYNYEWCLMKW